MCHIHSSEHAKCMVENPLMVIRCLDLYGNQEVYKEAYEELSSYINCHSVLLITNNKGIGENIYIKSLEGYVKVEESTFWSRFISHYLLKKKPLYRCIMNDDHFGWNLEGVGLSNLCVKYSSESQDYSNSSEYVWDEEGWSVSDMKSSLQETESVLADKECMNQEEFFSLVKEHGFSVYQILFSDGLKFSEYCID